MTQKDIEEFTHLLEANGYSGAMVLVMRDLLPVARKQGISLYATALRYANCDEDQDTSFYQLGTTLLKIPEEVLKRLDIHTPFTNLKPKKKRRR